jgi:hypothetical protein
LAKNKIVVEHHHTTHPNSLFANFFVPTDEAGFEMEAFANVAEIQRESLLTLERISVEDFGQCFQHCRDRWIQSQGHKFEDN